MKEPCIMVGHISPLMTLTNIILRRISPAFLLTARDIFPVMDIRYDEQRDVILPFLKNLVKTRTNFTEWWNEYMKLWDIFLPSWNEMTSCWDKFLPLLKIWLCHYSDIILLLWLSSRMYRGTNFSHFKNLGSKSDEVL